MNECLTTPQHEKQIGYWVSDVWERHFTRFTLWQKAWWWDGYTIVPCVVDYLLLID